jgi:hypothetical protein
MGDTQPYAEISIVIKDADGATTTINVTKAQDVTWGYEVVPGSYIDVPNVGSIPEMVDLKLSFRATHDGPRGHYTMAKADSDGTPIHDIMTTTKDANK